MTRTGPVTWRAEPRVVVDCLQYELPIDEARALIASLQRQIDALDPGAAIAEAERRMVEAHRRYRRLCDVRNMHEDVADMGAGAALGRLTDAVSHAAAACGRATDAWLALVEARDAKTGGDK